MNIIFIANHLKIWCGCLHSFLRKDPVILPLKIINEIFWEDSQHVLEGRNTFIIFVLKNFKPLISKIKIKENI